MAKTNYKKVEEALKEGMSQMTMAQFRILADQASGKSQVGDEVPLKLKRQLLTTLKIELHWLYQHDQTIYKKLEVKKSEIENYITQVSDLPQTDWTRIKEIKEKIETYKKEHHEILPSTSDETLVEEQILKHKNKRHNVNDKWLPLD